MKTTKEQNLLTLGKSHPKVSAKGGANSRICGGFLTLLPLASCMFLTAFHEAKSQNVALGLHEIAGAPFVHHGLKPITFGAHPSLTGMLLPAPAQDFQASRAAFWAHSVPMQATVKVGFRKAIPSGSTIPMIGGWLAEPQEVEITSPGLVKVSFQPAVKIPRDQSFLFVIESVEGKPSEGLSLRGPVFAQSHLLDPTEDADTRLRPFPDFLPNIKQTEFGIPLVGTTDAEGIASKTDAAFGKLDDQWFVRSRCLLHLVESTDGRLLGMPMNRSAFQLKNTKQILKQPFRIFSDNELAVSRIRFSARVQGAGAGAIKIRLLEADTDHVLDEVVVEMPEAAEDESNNPRAGVLDAGLTRTIHLKPEKIYSLEFQVADGESAPSGILFQLPGFESPWIETFPGILEHLGLSSLEPAEVSNNNGKSFQTMRDGIYFVPAIVF